MGGWSKLGSESGLSSEEGSGGSLFRWVGAGVGATSTGGTIGGGPARDSARARTQHSQGFAKRRDEEKVRSKTAEISIQQMDILRSDDMSWLKNVNPSSRLSFTAGTNTLRTTSCRSCHVPEKRRVSNSTITGNRWLRASPYQQRRERGRTR